MALNTAIKGLQIRDAFFGTGLKRNGTDGNIAELDLNELTTEATFDPNADFLAIVDATDNGSDKTLWSVIATAIAGTGITATNGVLSADTVADNVVESDIVTEDLSATADGVETNFTLANTPLTASVQVFLNGLLQQAGSGKDYTLAGSTVTFATAPETGDIVIVHYFIDNA